MVLKGCIEEDFTNYCKPSMFISTAYCTFKCERENPDCHCQNSLLALAPTIDVDNKLLVDKYINNPITKAIVLGGLEPLDQITELMSLIYDFRQKTDDEIIIYTGYNRSEVVDKISVLSRFKNVIVKFGRFVPNDKPRYDIVLGVTLASENQYAEWIS